MLGKYIELMKSYFLICLNILKICTSQPLGVLLKYRGIVYWFYRNI